MEERESKGGGVIGLIVGAVTAAIATVTLLWEKATQDGHLAAAFRQGIGELGEALKPFPESIQASEHGTLWNPTQGEIAADRKTVDYGNFQSSRLPSPSEIAREARGSVHGEEHGRVDLPQPSQIAARRDMEPAQPEHGNDGHGR